MNIVYLVGGIVFMVIMQLSVLFAWEGGYKIFGAWFLFAILHTLIRIEAKKESEP